MSRDSMGDRMKNYEASAESVLPGRLPVMLRLDGNSFSRLTKKLRLNKPYDERFERAMNAAARAVLEYASGAQLAYVQSDEISILLRNDQTHETQPFLANRVQKITSLTAAIASVAFCRAMADEGLDTVAAFDARVFVVPPAEVTNTFLWRQKDCRRNCVSGYAYYEIAKKSGRKTAARRLHGLSTNEQQELILSELGVDVNDLPVQWLRGRVLLRTVREVPLREVVGDEKFQALVAKGHAQPDAVVTRSSWDVDTEPPCFNQDRDYIERLLT